MGAQALGLLEVRPGDHLLIEDDLPSVHPVDPASREGLLVELGAREIDEMVPHRGNHGVDVPKIGVPKFDMVVDLKTARALGVTVPQSILIQATQIIQ
jgi:putative ABC transport system substrate-binding protein